MSTPPGSEPTVPSSPDEEYPVDRLKAKMNQSLAGRPFTVYLVLFAGAATLLLLLAVVWISASGGGSKEDQQICTEIAPADARSAVLAGQVEQVNVLVDKEHPVDTLTGIQLKFTDKTCRQTPQGADIRADLFSVIGAVDLYNKYADNSVSVHYRGQNIATELLSTSSPTVPATAAPTDTAAAPASPSSSPAPPPSPSASPSPTEKATAPALTPTATPTATRIIGPTATP
jgi:hypothetical protein